MNVPFCDLRVQHDALAGEIQAAIARVIRSSAFILGREVSAFEEQFAAYIGTRFAIGTSNGTTALMVALQALGVGPGDEVVVPAMTFFATAEAAALLGARPVFVDIDPKTLTMDPRLLSAKITSKTKVILPVHLYGHPADLDPIRSIASRFNIKLLGDCAHAHGALYRGRRVGGIEDCAAFSFYPSKNLGCLGEAGMITTDDPAIARLCRLYRDHGSDRKYVHDCVGTNARMEGLQAAVLAVKLPYLDTWNGERMSIARFFNERLSTLPLELPREAKGSTHVYHVYQVRTSARDEAVEYLTRMGVSVTLHYPVPMHLHGGFAYLGGEKGDFPVAEEIARTTLSLPCFPGMTEGQQSYVAGCVCSYFAQGAETAAGDPGAAAQAGQAGTSGE